MEWIGGDRIFIPSLLPLVVAANPTRLQKRATCFVECIVD